MTYSPPIGEEGYCRVCGKRRPLSKHGRCPDCIQVARVAGGTNGRRPPKTKSGKPAKPMQKRSGPNPDVRPVGSAVAGSKDAASLGGSEMARARARALTPEQRREISRAAAEARWADVPKCVQCGGRSTAYYQHWDDATMASTSEECEIPGLHCKRCCKDKARYEPRPPIEQGADGSSTSTQTHSAGRQDSPRTEFNQASPRDDVSTLEDWMRDDDKERALARREEVLAPIDDKELVSLNLQLREDSTFEEWEAEGRRLEGIFNRTMWEIANWITWGERKFPPGQMYDKAMTIFGLSYDRLSNIVSVAKAWPEEYRYKGMAFDRYEVLTATRRKDPDKAVLLLQRAREESWTRAMTVANAKGRPFLVGDDYTAHSHVQALLANLGTTMRGEFQIWVPLEDRNRVLATGLLDDSVSLLSRLPRQYGGDSEAHEVIRRIDVLWLKKGKVQAAFEIESTTSIFSGLLRMSDLCSLIGTQFRTDLYLVCPESRRKLVSKQARRPTFRDVGIPDNCKMITFERLTEKIDEISQSRALSYLAYEYVKEEIAEDFDAVKYDAVDEA